MSYWKSVNNANSAPLFVVNATTGQTGKQQYGNTVFGKSKGTPENGAGSPGWVRVVPGTGSRSGRKTVETLVAMRNIPPL